MYCLFVVSRSTWGGQINIQSKQIRYIYYSEAPPLKQTKTTSHQVETKDRQISRAYLDSIRSAHNMSPSAPTFIHITHVLNRSPPTVPCATARRHPGPKHRLKAIIYDKDMEARKGGMRTSRTYKTKAKTKDTWRKVCNSKNVFGCSKRHRRREYGYGYVVG
ncbi:hypothetical protein K504DRAFT_164829 [Pleomassaria siparia CBS 279.74]|uniref:Uncharacterized protein n=1 Tax=Pleomassaria siparia CBS 279.74 TaxID=1314801 RepID=A0A6G1JTC6_9PLEO|nr:hypothetical protein K504DRAFT_164829 [Pleomassaria siparia CBS 279.74]